MKGWKEARRERGHKEERKGGGREAWSGKYNRSADWHRYQSDMLKRKGSGRGRETVECGNTFCRSED